MATLPVVGSASMELEQAFRLMTLELATKLSEEECHKIAYVACVNETTPPKHGNELRLYLLNTLESRGQIGPLKLQFLEEILVENSIGRNDLLNLISRYKKKSVYKEAKKRKKERKPKKQQDQTVDLSNTVCQYEETYAIFLTQFAQMALSMRSALETGDIAKMKDAFSSVVSNGDAVTRTLRKNLSLAGVNSDSICTSSSGESSRMVSPNSTPPRARVSMEMSNDDHCPTDAILELEESSNDRNPSTQSTQTTAPVQRHCQTSQSDIPSNPMFVYRKSPSISQKLSLISSSNSDHNMDNTGDRTGTVDTISENVDSTGDGTRTGDSNFDDVDNTGTGTGDSGLGEMITHIPSKEALDEIDPDSRRDPLLDDDADSHLKGVQQAGYTPLMIRKLEPNHSNDSEHYAKPVIRQKENDYASAQH